MRYMRSPVLLAAITSALLGAAFTIAPFPAQAAVNGHTMVTPEPRPLTVQAPRAVPARPHRWTVKSGQSLSAISAAAYGDSSLWPSLCWINKAHVANPDMIRTGQVLKLSPWHPHAAWLDHAASHARPAPVVVVHIAHQDTGHRTYHRTYHRSYTATAGSYHGSGGYESCVIARESGGNAGAVNPSSGAGGLYQFLPSTWHSLGYAGLPQNASVSTQKAAFQRLYAQAGTSPWSPSDGC